MIHDTCLTASLDPDLAARDRLPEVVRGAMVRWAELPEAIRVAIEAMLKAAAKDPKKTLSLLKPSD